MSQEVENTEETPQNNGGDNKIEKAYNANMKKLIALMNGTDAFKGAKVSNDNVSGVVEELIKERKQQALEVFKKDAIEILDKKIEFDKEVKKLETELKNNINNKKGEFSKKMQALFSQVEDIANIEKSYAESLSSVED